MDKIKSLPLDEQPRNRLIEHGAEHLSDAELLAIILRTGTKHENVLELSRNVLREFNLKSLSTISYNQIKKIPGIKTAKACQILACFELARRLASYKVSSVQIKTPKDVVMLLKPSMQYHKKEYFIGLYLNTRHFIIRNEPISIGTLDTSLLHPREVFGPALTDGASSIIIVHNHPSGNPEPSDEDKKVTLALSSAGKIVGIQLIDHIIIGEQGYFSFSEQGLL
jgi:DNA repair protein RadC